MNAGVLYSGGKDSSIMAVILRKLDYKVELIIVNFGILPSWKAAAQSAKNLGFTHKILEADENILLEGVDMILAGFGYKTINNLSKKLFKVKQELTNINNNSDYEIEIRYIIDQLRGDETASRIFPEHMQSRVIGWREK